MDMNIKTEEAAIWIAEVNTEVDCVELVLKEVKACLEHDPDDDIWFEFERIVNNLSTYWDGLVKASKKVCSGLKSAIDFAEQVGNEIVSDIKASAPKMRG